jgi:6-pyruvoyltetrahydropterin/6-carboxytetrahydropterin synthase
MGMARYEVTFETQFSAKHALRHYHGRTEPKHGHNFRVVVVVSAARVDRAGMVIDFLELKERVDAETGRLQGTFLNDDVAEFLENKRSPSAENIAATLFRRLRKSLPKAVRMESVSVGEAPGCSATYRDTKGRRR